MTFGVLSTESSLSQSEKKCRFSRARIWINVFIGQAFKSETRLIFVVKMGGDHYVISGTFDIDPFGLGEIKIE